MDSFSTSPGTSTLLLDKVAAAQTLNMSVRQLTRFVASGELTPIRLGPRLIRFTPAELEAFVTRRSYGASTREWPQVERQRRHGRR